MPRVVVVIPVATTWPSGKELDARNAVIDSLNAAHIGSFTGSGGGLGAMDFSYEVADLGVARAAVDRARREHMPGVEYRVVTE